MHLRDYENSPFFGEDKPVPGFMDAMNEQIQNINKFVNEKIEEGIRTYISVEGSVREQQLEVLVKNMSKENIKQAHEMEQIQLTNKTLHTDLQRALDRLKQIKQIMNNLGFEL